MKRMGLPGQILIDTDTLDLLLRKAVSAGFVADTE
jgi:hypothetical protein